MSAPKVTVVGGCGISLLFDVGSLPSPGETVLASAVRYVSGGKAANQAIGASRLGARATLVSAVGHDDLAERTRRLLRQERVADHTVLELDGPTMLGAVLTDPRGGNQIAAVPGALRELTAAHIRTCADAITSADVCLVSLEIPAEPAREALALARGNGVITVLNPAPAPSARAAAQLLPLCDYVTPNEPEAYAMAGTARSPQHAAQALLDAGAATVIITRGSHGVLAFHAGRPLAVPAEPVERVTDTSGAGDAFNAALAVTLAEGGSVAEACLRGCRFAAVIVQQHGFAAAPPPRPRVPDRVQHRAAANGP